MKQKAGPLKFARFHNQSPLLTMSDCSNVDISHHSILTMFTCENNRLFSREKISCFCAKAHLVFHCWLYNKIFIASLYLGTERAGREAVPKAAPI